MGEPNGWLTAFLPGILLGGAVDARVTGDLRVRGERPVRYVRLVVGGIALARGARIVLVRTPEHR